MNYIAHKVLIDGKEKIQTIKEHSINVAELVREFSKNYCDNDIAYNLGLLHDVGKYQNSFQRRINGSNDSVKHAVCGAKVCQENLFGFDFNLFGQFVISCHHTGLCDLGDSTNTENDSTLKGKMKAKTEDFSYYQKELPLINTKIRCPMKVSIKTKEEVWPDYAFWIRFMFSCLTDADFLDTEKFCKNINRKIDCDVI